MSEEFHKPTQYSGDKFDTYEGGEDPAVIHRAAHDTAHALIDHARGTDDPAVVDRLVAYTDEHGVDALAELWARSNPKSLPGALWRIYLIRLLIRQDPDATSYLFQRGTEVLGTIDAAVAGAPMPTGPDEITALAELWARSSPKSLPGALWRIYLIRVLIRQDADATSYLFQRGTEVLGTIDAAVAGAPMPTGPDEITALADEILRGMFRGDFAVALERASAFCRIMSAGATSIADDVDVVTPERATELTTRALRFTLTGEELTAAARLHRAGTLE